MNDRTIHFIPATAGQKAVEVWSSWPGEVLRVGWRIVPIVAWRVVEDEDTVTSRPVTAGDPRGRVGVINDDGSVIAFGLGDYKSVEDMVRSYAERKGWAPIEPPLPQARELPQPQPNSKRQQRAV